MPLIIELWEDSGTLLAGRGTTTLEVDNLGWKDSGLDETFAFSDYPNGRPYASTDILSTSYKKYYFYKIYGTYTDADQPTIQFGGTPLGTAQNLQIVYKWTNQYQTPDNTLLSGTTFDPALPPIWFPLLSTTGPDGTMSEVKTLINNTTYYTPYLVTQLLMFPSTDNDYGNLDDLFSLQFDIDENKTGLPGFDETQINWTP